MTVTDDDGLSDSASIQIKVTEPPVAVLRADNNSGNAPLMVNFDGSGSYDPDGEIVSYAWDFDDGGASTEMSPSHPYNNAGTYTATLTVTDADGLSGSANIQIKVTQPPVAVIVADNTSGYAPLTVNFDGSGSYDPDGEIVSYAWDFGDNGASTEMSPSHPYNNAGNYTATLTVADVDGLSDSASIEISVEIPCSVCDIGSDSCPHTPCPVCDIVDDTCEVVMFADNSSVARAGSLTLDKNQSSEKEKGSKSKVSRKPVRQNKSGESGTNILKEV